MHLHAALALTTSREPVVASKERASGRVAGQVEWNERLLSTLAAGCYSSLLAALAALEGLEIGGRPARCKVDERPDDDAARAAAAAAAAKARLDGSPS